jgi:hypothetical protein
LADESALGKFSEKCARASDLVDERTKITVRKPTYSQKRLRAAQKENIFCRVYANLK